VKTRIAVFNHSQFLLDQFRVLLEKHNFTVLTYLQDAVQQPDFDGTVPDLIILGHIRGYPANFGDIIARVRRDPATQAVPVLVCTTGEAHPDGLDGHAGVSYAPITVERLNLEHVLIGVQLALGLPPEDLT
jgi:hypothetical protein